jgi:hypothetical protein
MNKLHSQLEEIAETFINAILKAMGSASLADLADGHSVARAKGRPSHVGQSSKPVELGATAKHRTGAAGRRRRATAEEVQAQKDAVFAVAKQLGQGFAKNDVTKKVRSKEDVGRMLALLVAEGRLTKKGDRRLTTYSVK